MQGKKKREAADERKDEGVSQSATDTAEQRGTDGPGDLLSDEKDKDVIF